MVSASGKTPHKRPAKCIVNGGKDRVIKGERVIKEPFLLVNPFENYQGI